MKGGKVVSLCRRAEMSLEEGLCFVKGLGVGSYVRGERVVNVDTSTKE